MNNDLLGYIAKVGTGEKGAKSLSYEEARASMKAILEGRFHPVTLGAFCMALRWKPETPEEFAGFRDELAESCKELNGEVPGEMLDHSGAYDGFNRTIYPGLAVGLTCAKWGMKIFLNGSREIPTKFGVVYEDLVESCGIPRPEWSGEKIQKELGERGIVYVSQREFHPALHQLKEYRAQIGKRVFLNTIEPFLNPLKLKYKIGSFFHRVFGLRIAEFLLKTRIHRYEKVALVAGVEGSEFLRLGKTYVVLIHGGIIKEETFDSREFGFEGDIERELVDRGLSREQLIEKSQRYTKLFLDNDARCPLSFRNWVLWNVAFRLWFVGRFSSLKEAGRVLRERYPDF